MERAGFISRCALEGECNEMTVAHISRSTRQYHRESFTPAEASAKVIDTRPESDPMACGWLGASLREF